MELKVMGWGVFKNNIYWKRIFISAGLYLKKNQQINVTGDAVLESNKTSEDTCQVPDDQNRGTPWQFSLSLAPPSDFGKNLNYHSGFSTPAHYYRWHCPWVQQDIQRFLPSHRRQPSRERERKRDRERDIERENNKVMLPVTLSLSPTRHPKIPAMSPTTAVKRERERERERERQRQTERERQRKRQGETERERKQQINITGNAVLESNEISENARQVSDNGRQER
jgi:hypothetical protein